MSLSILEITTIPKHTLINSDINVISSTFKNILSYVFSISQLQKTAIELILLKSEDASTRIFLIFRNQEEGLSVSENQAISVFSSYLTNSYYSVQTVVDEDFHNVVKRLRNQLSGKVVALTKAEKIVSSSASYSGYYYYTDILLNESIGNFDDLFNYLATCKNAMISFQLIPTQLSQEEYFALSNLSAELKSTKQGVMVNGQFYREAGTDELLKTYSHYSSNYMQPMFLGNILVASNTDDLSGLVSAVESSIQTSSDEHIDLVSTEICANMFVHNFFEIPWTIHNLLLNCRNANIWNGSVYQPSNLYRLPYLYTISEALNFFFIPFDNGRIQGVKSNSAANDNESINEAFFSKDNIRLGNLFNDTKMLGVGKNKFTRHALVVGVPGSGKTTFAISTLLQFHKKGIPFLAIEPTKTEYRALIDKIPNLQVFTPGNNDVVPFIFNPFIPPKGIRLEQYIPSLMTAFKTAFSMETPLDSLFLRAVRKCYSQYGWKNYSKSGDKDVIPFGLFEFILVFKKMVSSSNYKADIRANIETGGTFRLLNLIDQNKYIYDTVNTISIDDLLTKSTVIELNAIEDVEQKSLIMSLLLVCICLYTKNKGSSSNGIQNLIMIDEAHVLLGESNSTTNEKNKAQHETVKSLQRMIAEIRSFGTGIIIADQEPSKVSSEIIANTDIKVVFRLVEKQDRDIIANSMNMSDTHYQYLAQSKSGEAIVFFSGLKSPKIITTPDIRANENIEFGCSDEDLRGRVNFWEEHQSLLIPYNECAVCDQCRSCGKCDIRVREKADYYAAHIFSSIGTNIKDNDSLIKYLYRLHEYVIKMESKEPTIASLKKLCNCSKIQFLRNVLLENNIYLSKNAIKTLLQQTLIKEAKKDV